MPDLENRKLLNIYPAGDSLVARNLCGNRFVDLDVLRNEEATYGRSLTYWSSVEAPLWTTPIGSTSRRRAAVHEVSDTSG
jgi:hypothetical protein